jgi:RimJ/RimL family protein N-acetyltransferase
VSGSWSSAAELQQNLISYHELNNIVQLGDSRVRPLRPHPLVPMFESIAIKTKTKFGRDIEIREMRFKDILGIRRSVVDPRFSMPYLTGTPDPITRPVIPMLRAIDYVAKAMASRFLGRLIFGARRHWIMSVRDAASGEFLGVTLLDAVVRFPRLGEVGQLSRIVVEQHKSRMDERIGDAEWGFFLHPDFWGQGIALQAIYALTSTLANTRSWCAPDGSIVRRVWAETGVNNHQAISLLEKAGLVIVTSKAIPATVSPRFDRNGKPLELSHFDQPAEHSKLNPDAPVKVMIQEIENRHVVVPGWQILQSISS